MATTDKPASPSKDVEIKELAIERGVDQALVFTNPYRPTGESAVKQEVFRYSEEEAGPTLAQLNTMRRLDGHARALFRLLTLPIRAALLSSTFLPTDDGEAEAKFIEEVFLTPPSAGGMSLTFHRFMAQTLGALFDGFAAFEKVYWVPTTGPLKGKITLRKLAHRPSKSITFITDETGGFEGFRQRTTYSGKVIDVYIPRDYAFYYAANEEERKYYGVSFFEAAYSHYDKKARLYFTAHLAAQRAAVGTRVGTVPANASNAAKREFKEALSNLSLAQFMMMPDKFKVEVLQEGGTFDFLNLINHHNHMMSESVLANFFDSNTGAGSNEGSLVNFARPGDDMFQLMLRAIMDDIAESINYYVIPPLVDLNFKSKKYPKFTWGKLTDEQREAIASTFDKLVTNSENLTPEFIRALEEHQAKEFGLDVDYEAVAEREAEEAAMAQQAEMQAAQAGAAGAPSADPVPLSSEQLDWSSLEAFEESVASSTPVALSAVDDEERERAVALFSAALGRE